MRNPVLLGDLSEHRKKTETVKEEKNERILKGLTQIFRGINPRKVIKWASTFQKKIFFLLALRDNEMSKITFNRNNA